MPQERENDEESIPLAAETFRCASCGADFVPRGGESTCVKCLHVHVDETESVRAESTRESRLCKGCGYDLRGLDEWARCSECGRPQREMPEDTSSETSEPRRASAKHVAIDRRLVTARRSLRRAPREELMEHRPARALLVGAHIAVAMVLHVMAIMTSAAHWWSGFLDSWGAAWTWACMCGAAIALASPAVLPREAGPSRWPVVAAIAGSALAALGLAGYPLLGVGIGIAARAGCDFLTIVGAIAYLAGMGTRVGEISSWEGHDPGDRTFFASAAPPMIALFIMSTSYLLTFFFRRRLDHADVFGLGIAAWMLCRLIAIAWHAYEAGATRIDRDRRNDRYRSGAAVGSTNLSFCSCGYDRRGTPPAHPCPECGARARS